VTTVWFIFAKELIDTLRDRRTLIFMLLIPALLIPGLILGMTRFTLHVQKKQAVKVVKIAADEATRLDYARIVHHWFLSTEADANVPEGVRGMLKPFIRPRALEQIGLVSQNVFTDAAAFDQWIHEVTREAREVVAVLDFSGKAPALELPKPLQDYLIDFYKIAIRGLGLIEFVDPASLPKAPADFEPEFKALNLRPLANAKDIAWALKARQVHGYLQTPKNIDQLQCDDQRALEITLFHDSTVSLSEEAYRRVEYVITKAGHALVQRRLEGRKLKPGFIRPLAMKPATDLATISEIALDKVGGLLPYIVILFALLGAMYPAIDLGAGEKERNTLETLLLAPSSRTEIALGKLLVIFLTSMVAALLGLCSILLSVRHIVPPNLMEMLNLRIEPSMVVYVMLLVIPLAAALSALCLAISVTARSFKEAQNYLAPLQLVVILPALAPMIPGLEMNWKLAFVPLVNVSMLAKDFLAGETHWGYYFATLVSSLALTAVCVAYAIRQFSREYVLFRT